MNTVTVKCDEGVEVSDGYHTFSELYDHRIALWIALCRVYSSMHSDCWRSMYHSDGTSIPGWFVLGIGRDIGDQITYHLPMSQWDATDFASDKEEPPRFDGHTSSDVLERLGKL